MKNLKLHFLVINCIQLTLCSSAWGQSNLSFGQVNASAVGASPQLLFRDPLPPPIPIPTPITAAPVISPNGGTFASAQTVSISDTTPNRTIYYTTNGTTPTTSSTRYAGAFTVSSTETVEAIAVAPGFNQSAITTDTFTIDVPVAYTISQTTEPIGPLGRYQISQVNANNGDLIQQMFVTLPSFGLGHYPNIGGLTYANGVLWLVSQTMDPIGPLGRYQLSQVNANNGDLIQQMFVTLPSVGLGYYLNLGGLTAE